MKLEISKRPFLTAISSLALCFLALPHPSDQNHYCSISRDHTLCKFQGVGPRCKTPMEIGITSRERQQIMHLHNSLRQMVTNGAERRGRGGAQPMASNMRQMEWDDELALSAQRLAEQCKYNHDCLNCRKVDRFLTGQNLYQFSENIERDGSNWEQAMMAWYDEVARFSPRHVDHFEFIKELGHYTQMLWADTYKVGCGYVYYKDGKWNRKLYVCNYGPAGNIITTQMYRRGSPCSECPEGTQCSSQYPGLCSGGGGGGRPFFPPAAPAPRPTSPRPTTTTTRRTTTTTTTTPRPTTTRRTTTTTQRTYPTTEYTHPTTQRTFPTTRRTFPTTRRTFPTTPRTFHTTRRTFPTTPRTFPTTTFPSKIIFNELESNELGLTDNFATHDTGLTNHVGLNKQNRLQNQNQRPQETRHRFQNFPTSQKQATTPRLTFSRFVTTRKPFTTSTTTTTPRTTKQPFSTTAKKSFTFSPRIDPSPATIKRNRFKNSITNFPTRKPSFSTFDKGTAPETKVVRVDQTPVLSVEDSNSIMLFCDFDYAKCPVRSMGTEGWNYTAYETPGYGHGFSSIVRPGLDSHLQIRSDVLPSTRDGSVCVHFRFVQYLFGVDGGFQKSDGLNPKTRQPLKFAVAATPISGDSGSSGNTAEFQDKSRSAYDWLTGRIQFKDLKSQFILSFKVPPNPLYEDNQYLALDDVLITQGKCHT